MFRLFRDCVWKGGIKERPLERGERNNFLLEISNLRTLRRKETRCGRASANTTFLHIIHAEVARLQALTLAKKKQSKLKRLKLILKVMHLVAQTPSAVQDHRITSFQAASSCEQWQKIQRSAQGVLKMAVKEIQQLQTLLSEKCREQVICDSTKNVPPKQQYEVQVEEVLEIHVSDEIFADEPPLESGGDEMPLSGLQDAMEPENITLSSGGKIEGGNCVYRVDREEYMYFQVEDQSDRPEVELFQNSDDDQGDLSDIVDSFQGLYGNQSDNLPDLESFQGLYGEQSEMLQGDEVVGVCKVMQVWVSEDMEAEDVFLQPSSSLAETVFIWISSFMYRCFGCDGNSR